MSVPTWLAAARGDEPADMVLKGGAVFNVFSGDLEPTDVAVKDGLIVGLGDYQGVSELDVRGKFLAPGFIDAHLHLESTMITPAELARVVVPRGTTALVADPHEIANVLGLRGIQYLIDITSELPMDVFFMAPSCVPATHMETGGAELNADDLAELVREPRILGLAEMMNFPGVVNGFEDVWDKLELFRDRVIDGHAPMLSGQELCAYLAGGISTEHESSTLKEAREKLARGMYVFLREGSAARNLRDLIPLINDHNHRRTAFCSDDRHPEDLVNQGHMDDILRNAVALGLDAVRAVTMATLNPAEAYGLKRRGALAPGYIADIVVLSDLAGFEAETVIKNGRVIAQDNELILPPSPTDIPDWAGPMNVRDLTVDRFRIKVTGPKVNVIELIPGQLVTNHLVEDTPQTDGVLLADTNRDLLLAAVVERHKGSGNIGLGLVKGMGLKQGALASSVAHDSHNIVAVGVTAESLYKAVQAVINMRGGLAVASEDDVIAQLPLPLAGLMSDRPAGEVASALTDLDAAASQLGCKLPHPFMTLSFAALPVIPSLKLTDKGLVDVGKFDFLPLFAK
jgi:adenine deaminase